jgi:hypothetical protein
VIRKRRQELKMTEKSKSNGSPQTPTATSTEQERLRRLDRLPRRRALTCTPEELIATSWEVVPSDPRSEGLP